jgi:formylglycine-generating enzyme required for sulfatase activity
VTLTTTNAEAIQAGAGRTKVILSKFWVGRTEVTQAQYQAIMGQGTCRFQGSNLPMDEASWNDAMAFCRKLTERERAAGRLPEGYAYALPTEAQWEYACRAGSRQDDANDLDERAWYKKTSAGTTHSVGTKRPNAWGLYDMQGNVREYCLDWFGTYPGGTLADYAGPETGDYRVCRGGGWADSAGSCQPSSRGYRSEGRREEHLGFRIVLSRIR